MQLQDIKSSNSEQMNTAVCVTPLEEFNIKVALKCSKGTDGAEKGTKNRKLFYFYLSNVDNGPIFFVNNPYLKKILYYTFFFFFTIPDKK